MPRKQKKGHEALHPTLDVVRHQPVRDIIPYFSFLEPTTVKSSNKQGSDRFYAGFCLPESMLLDRQGNDFIFEWRGDVLLVPAGTIKFVDHEGISWPTL